MKRSRFSEEQIIGILKEHQAGLSAAELGKLPSPARRRACIDHVREKFQVSERFACRVLGQHRSTQRKVPQGRADEDALTADIIALASR